MTDLPITADPKTKTKYVILSGDSPDVLSVADDPIEADNADAAIKRFLGLFPALAADYFVAVPTRSFVVREPEADTTPRWRLR